MNLKFSNQTLSIQPFENLKPNIPLELTNTSKELKCSPVPSLDQGVTPSSRYQERALLDSLDSRIRLRRTILCFKVQHRGRTIGISMYPH